MNQRCLLMIAYHYPPMGGAGVQRAQKFARYLPEHGWIPTVLTVKHTHSYAQSRDYPGPPEEISILRTPALRLPVWLPFSMRHAIERWVLVLDGQVGWYPFALRASQKMISQSTISAIFSTSAPYTSHLIAMRLKKQSSIPWIADFRDPWVAGLTDRYPTRTHRWINLLLEKKVFHTADAIILNTPEAAALYRERYRNLAGEKIHYIPNGFDPADLLGSAQTSQIVNAKFTIVHSGSLYRSTRSGRYFVRAVHMLLSQGRINRERLTVRLIGHLDPETPHLVKTLDMQDVFNLPGYVSHAESVQSLCNADLLVLLPSLGEGSELYIPGKLYEYLAAGKPILALAQPGAVTRLLEELQVGDIIDPYQVAEIAGGIEKYYRRWIEGSLPSLVQPDMIQQFDRRHLTARLASLLDKLTTGTT